MLTSSHVSTVRLPGITCNSGIRRPQLRTPKLHTSSPQNIIEAAQSYPSDDLQTIQFYTVALELCWVSPEGKTLEEMLPLFCFIDDQLPHVVKIWEHYEPAQSTYVSARQALDFPTRCQAALKNGKITSKSYVRPIELVSAHSLHSHCYTYLRPVCNFLQWIWTKWKGAKYVYI